MEAPLLFSLARSIRALLLPYLEPRDVVALRQTCRAGREAFGEDFFAWYWQRHSGHMEVDVSSPLACPWWAPPSHFALSQVLWAAEGRARLPRGPQSVELYVPRRDGPPIPTTLRLDAATPQALMAEWQQHAVADWLPARVACVWLAPRAPRPPADNNAHLEPVPVRSVLGPGLTLPPRRPGQVLVALPASGLELCVFCLQLFNPGTDELVPCEYFAEVSFAFHVTTIEEDPMVSFAYRPRQEDAPLSSRTHLSVHLGWAAVEVAYASLCEADARVQVHDSLVADWEAFLDLACSFGRSDSTRSMPQVPAHWTPPLGRHRLLPLSPTQWWEIPECARLLSTCSVLWAKRNQSPAAWRSLCADRCGRLVTRVFWIAERDEWEPDSFHFDDLVEFRPKLPKEQARTQRRRWFNLDLTPRKSDTVLMPRTGPFFLLYCCWYSGAHVRGRFVSYVVRVTLSENLSLGMESFFGGATAAVSAVHALQQCENECTREN